MANTLTNLVPTLYEALDTVSRELVGFIPAVRLDPSVARAAVGQQVLSFVTPASSASDLTPGVTAPNDGDQIIGNVSLTIQKSRGVPVRWNGEEQRGVDGNGNGPGYNRILTDQFAQAMRTLCNEIENDVAQAAYVAASRAYGTAGTTPFATDLSATANVLKILSDNGAPPSDLHLVIDTTSGAKMRTLTQLTKANEAGDTSLLRQGMLLDVHGFAIRESAKVPQAVAVGNGANYTTNTAGYAVGATAITLITGTGAINAGDIVTFAGDANQYVVASALAGGVVTLAAPGLQKAVPAAATAVTVVGAATRNMAFNRNAIVLATRAPAVPKEGDMADDAMIITDPKSGLSFEVRLYKQYRQIRYEIAASWGVKAVKSEHIASLLG